MRNYIFLLLLIITTAANAGNIMLEQANMYYHNQEYNEAAKMYAQMLNDGYKDKVVYYNAGNAYYKIKELGKAHWCFLKAKALDADNILIDENLALTRQKANIGTQRNNKNWFNRSIHNLLKWHTINKWALFALLACIVSSILFFIRKVINVSPIIIGFQKLFFCVSIFYLVALAVYGYHLAHTREGVIITNTPVQRNLLEKNKGIYNATNGEIVLIVNESKPDSNNNFYQVSFVDGREGWLKSDKVWGL